MIKLDYFKNDDAGKLLLRFTIGFLMMLHGIAKITFEGSMSFIFAQFSEVGLPTFLGYGVFLGEIIAPLMIIAGFYSRLGGLLIVGNMFVAIVLVHMGELVSLGEHGGHPIEVQAFYLLGGLCVALLGSGRFALKSD